MLMNLELMKHAEPIGENQHHFAVDGASAEVLAKAIAFEESYSFIYGHQIFDNLDEIKIALDKKRKG